jgi:hypothetical protein
LVCTFVSSHATADSAKPVATRVLNRDSLDAQLILINLDVPWRLLENQIRAHPTPSAVDISAPRGTDHNLSKQYQEFQKSYADKNEGT